MNDLKAVKKAHNDWPSLDWDLDMNWDLDLDWDWPALTDADLWPDDIGDDWPFLDAADTWLPATTVSQ